MSILDEYFEGGCSISLENVTYKKLNEIEGEITLSVKDYLEIKEKSPDSGNIEFLISRSLSFEPKALADIRVSFGLVLELKDQYKDSTQLNYELIKDEMCSGDNVVVPIIMSRISLLISQLTASYGERPIITPPSFMITE